MVVHLTADCWHRVGRWCWASWCSFDQHDSGLNLIKSVHMVNCRPISMAGRWMLSWACYSTRNSWPVHNFHRSFYLIRWCRRICEVVINMRFAATVIIMGAYFCLNFWIDAFLSQKILLITMLLGFFKFSEVIFWDISRYF